MPKRKEPELTPAEQKKRFEELARQSGASGSSEDLKKILKVIAKKRPAAKRPQR